MALTVLTRACDVQESNLELLGLDLEVGLVATQTVFSGLVG